MLDVATCCKTRLSRPGFASVQSLRELKQVLQSAHAAVRDHTRPETQHRYLLEAGGADGDIACPAEIEPTPVACSSAIQPALDRSAVGCSTKDRALAGAGTKTASRKKGRGRTRQGGAERVTRSSPIMWNERPFSTCANPRPIKFRVIWKVRNCSMPCGIDCVASAGVTSKLSMRISADPHQVQWPERASNEWWRKSAWAMWVR